MALSASEYRGSVIPGFVTDVNGALATVAAPDGTPFGSVISGFLTDADGRLVMTTGAVAAIQDGFARAANRALVSGSADGTPMGQVLAGLLTDSSGRLVTGSGVASVGDGFANAANGGLAIATTAYVFNGTNQYLEIADADDLGPATSGATTVEAWMRPDVLTFPVWEDTGYVHWMGKADFNDPLGPPYARGEYMCRMYNLTNTEAPPRPNRISGYAFNLRIGTGVGSFFEDPVTVGQWIHFAFVINTTPAGGTDSNGNSYDKGWTKLYKNGVLRDQDALDNTSTSTVITPSNSTAPFRVGTSDAQNSYFQGAIAKIAVYNSELSAARILAHYNTGLRAGGYDAAVSSDLPRLYINGSSATDASGNGHTVTAFGSPPSGTV